MKYELWSLIPRANKREHTYTFDSLKKAEASKELYERWNPDDVYTIIPIAEQLTQTLEIKQ